MRKNNINDRNILNTLLSSETLIPEIMVYRPNDIYLCQRFNDLKDTTKRIEGKSSSIHNSKTTQLRSAHNIQLAFIVAESGYEPTALMTLAY